MKHPLLAVAAATALLLALLVGGCKPEVQPPEDYSQPATQPGTDNNQAAAEDSTSMDDVFEELKEGDLAPPTPPAN